MKELELKQLEREILEGKSIDKVIEEAKKNMNDERVGEQLGLKTRFSGLNNAMNKYFRFSHVTEIAGASGSGKSYLLNILEEDFFDDGVGGLNADFPHEKLLLSFKFEMDGADEVIRTVSRKMGRSYNYMLSSEYVGKDTYNTLTEAEYQEALRHLEKMKGKPIMYFEKMGTWKDILSTIKYYYYKFPNKKLIVTLDHSLLTKKAKYEAGVLDTIQNLAVAAIMARKFYGCMVIILGQLNSNIESTDRRTKYDLHYPIKSDIYAQAQLYWACDNVFVLHRPELLGITRYGTSKLFTTDLAHLICIKSRKGRTGNVWLESRLGESTFRQVNGDYFKQDRKKDLL